MKSTIITGGNISNYEYIKNNILDNSYIICVDGGIRHLKELGYKPNIVLGDFDSCNMDHLEELKKLGVPIVTYPSKKDKTDTEIAIDYAIEKKSSEIIIVGGIGTRFDHTLANIHIMLKAIHNGIKCWLVNENNKITLINDTIKIQKGFGTYLSLIPLTSKVEGITTKGLLYELNNSDITIGMSLGVSNEIISKEAEISIKKGVLIVIQSID